MKILMVLFFVVGFIQLFYNQYLAAITVYANRSSLTWKQWCACFIPVVVMLTFDVVANLTLAAIMFFDIPKELLVTKRLERYKSDDWPADFRKSVAIWICANWLNPFAPDHHHC